MKIFLNINMPYANLKFRTGAPSRRLNIFITLTCYLNKRFKIEGPSQVIACFIGRFLISDFRAILIVILNPKCSTKSCSRSLRVICESFLVIIEIRADTKLRIVVYLFEYTSAEYLLKTFIQIK